MVTKWNCETDFILPNSTLHIFFTFFLGDHTLQQSEIILVGSLLRNLTRIREPLWCKESNPSWLCTRQMTNLLLYPSWPHLPFFQRTEIELKCNQFDLKLYRWPDHGPKAIHGFCDTNLLTNKVKALPWGGGYPRGHETPGHDLCHHFCVFMIFSVFYKKKGKISWLGCSP